MYMKTTNNRKYKKPNKENKALKMVQVVAMIIVDHCI